MDVKDLMVGDWYNISADGISINKRVDCFFFCEWVTHVFMHPIPLTSEILELNGFEIIEGRYGINRYRIIDNDMVVIVEPMKIESQLGNSWFWVTISHRSDVVQPRITYPLTDVHVFQHLLRLPLCGLSELADNFKVEKGE